MVCRRSPVARFAMHAGQRRAWHTLRLHGPAVDQILADEQLDIGTGETDGLLRPL